MTEPASALRTLRSGFLRSAAAFPQRVALEVDGASLSYAELAGRAGALAETLRRHTPAGGPKLTAVFGQRSSTVYAGLLGALLNGDGYVPLNPAFPPERTRQMLERSGARALIADEPGAKRLVEVLDGVERPLLLILPHLADVSTLEASLPRHTLLGRDALAQPSGAALEPVDPNGVAYLLFTSGSTGVPKGVKVAHRNVVPFVDAVVARYGITEQDRFSQTFDLTFDLSVFDLFVAWERGARVCVPTQAQKLLPQKYVTQSQLTVWFSVPSTGALMNRLRMLRPGLYPRLRWSLFCGEALPSEIATAWAEAAPASTLENLYGPTELTIACTLYRWDAQRSPAECEMGVVPIGEPFPGMEVLVADERLHEVAPGEVGELLMTGPQLSLGYLDDPEKTASAFVTPPGREQVFYRTGDRVRRSDGQKPLVYLGRVDNQIKIQGYRVELGEIEAAIREEASVDVAIAIGWPRNELGGADGVVGFVAGRDLPVERVRARVAARLPAYMAPREIRCLPELPLNANGKVDRKALLALLDAAK
ncbi:MAG: amino acid adenylation domain-containing protein [Myxococcota bacterium]